MTEVTTCREHVVKVTLKETHRLGMNLWITPEMYPDLGVQVLSAD